MNSQTNWADSKSSFLGLSFFFRAKLSKHIWISIKIIYHAFSLPVLTRSNQILYALHGVVVGYRVPSTGPWLDQIQRCVA